MESLTSEKQQLDEEKDEHFRVKTNLEFDISDLRDSEKSDRESRVSQYWTLHNTDTIGTLPNCPYYRGVLSSEVDKVQQATPLSQRGSLKLPRLTKKGLKEV